MYSSYNKKKKIEEIKNTYSHCYVYKTILSDSPITNSVLLVRKLNLTEAEDHPASILGVITQFVFSDFP